MTTDNKDGQLFSKVAPRDKWWRDDPPHDAPPEPAPTVAFYEAAYHTLAVELDALVALEGDGERSPDGYRIYRSFSSDHPRPFVVGDTLYK